MVNSSREDKVFAFQLMKNPLWTFMILMLPEISRVHPGLVMNAGHGKTEFFLYNHLGGRHHYQCHAT